MKIRVFIPTLNAGPAFEETLAALAAQNVPFELMVVDSGSTDGTVERALSAGARVVPIRRAAFDHGGTRNFAERDFEGRILVFITQDAVPVGPDWLRKLTAPIASGEVAACYGRQRARAEASPTERIERAFNYPSESRTKRWSDVDELGIKTFFFSNVCSAVDVEAFRAVGGFPERTILSEDMMLAVRLLRNGWSVRYQANAVVMHSHHYPIVKEFQRYFDHGVSFAEWGDQLPEVPVTSEGMRMLRYQCATLLRNGEARHIPRAIARAGAKYAGYVLGTHFRWLPRGLRRRLSMHKGYWQP